MKNLDFINKAKLFAGSLIILVSSYSMIFSPELTSTWYTYYGRKVGHSGPTDIGGEVATNKPIMLGLAMLSGAIIIASASTKR